MRPVRLGRQVARASVFSVPVPELWVPRPFELRSGQALAFCARAGGYDAAGTMGSSCQRTASHLWRLSPALYHLLLLPPIAFSTHRAESRPLPFDSGTDAPALLVCGCRISRHAGTHPPSFDGTRGRNSLDCDASAEAAHGPLFIAQAQTEEPAPTQSVWRRAEAQSVLAGAFL